MSNLKSVRAAGLSSRSRTSNVQRASSRIRAALLGSTALIGAVLAPQADAHTNALGFIVTPSLTNSALFQAQIFYGTYHGGVTSPEGSLQLRLSDGTVIGTSAFALVPGFTNLSTNVAPTGLVPGTNFFQLANASSTTFSTPYLSQRVMAYQSVTFDLLSAGDYQFGYTAGSAFTDVFRPYNNLINAGTFSITSGGNLGNVGGATTVPNIDTAVSAYTTTQLNAAAVNPVFTGGTLSVANTGTLTSNFSVASAGGTFNTSGNELTVAGTIANAIGGGGGLTVTGGGRLILAANNTYTGGTTVNGGVLQLNTTTAAGTGTIHMVDPTLVLNAAGTYTNEIALEVAGTPSTDPTILQNTSGGTVTITGQVHETGVGAPGQYVTFAQGTTVLTNTANTWTGVTTVNSGTTLQGTTQTISGGSIVDNGTLTFNQTNSGGLGQNISGAGTVNVTGLNPGQDVTFSGVLNFTGDLNVIGSTVGISGARSAGRSVVSGTGGLLVVNGGGSLDRSDQAVLLNGTNAGLINLGTISATSGVAVQGAGVSSTVNNLSGGLITTATGNVSAIESTGATTLSNGGTIRNTGGTGTGGAIRVSTGNLDLTNNAGGTLSSANGWTIALGSNVTGTVVNNGTITAAGNGYGFLTNGGNASITNNAGGVFEATGINGAILGNSSGAGTLSITNGGIIRSAITNGNGTIGLFGGGGSFTNLSGGQLTSTGTRAALAIGTDGSAVVDLQAGSTVAGAITSSGAGVRTITVAGALNGAYTTSSGASVDTFTLASTGSMTSANLGAGDDAFLYQGGTFSGQINGGTGTDSFTSNIGTGVARTINLANVAGFETFNHLSGDLTLTGAGASPSATINAGNGTPTGTLIFNGTTGLTGAINVNGATIRAETAGAFGTGTITTLDPTIQYAATGAYANNIVLNSVDPVGDPTRIEVGDGVTATLTGNITEGSAGQPLVFGLIPGATAGTTVLTGANNWTGATTIETGATLQGTTTSISGSNVVNNGALIFNQGVNGTFNRVISGGGTLTTSGASRVTLAAANTYTGDTIIDAGATLALSGAGSITSSRVIANGTFDISTLGAGSSVATIDKSADFYGAYTGSTTSGQSSTLTYQVSGYGPTGVIAFTNASGVITNVIRLTSTPVYDQNVFYNYLSGDPLIGSTCAPAAQTVCLTTTGQAQDLAAAVNQINGGQGIFPNTGVTYTATIIEAAAAPGNTSIVSLAGNGSVLLGANTLTLSNAADTFSGAISGTGGLTLAAGTQTLSGANTYTGLTSITGGTLELRNGAAIVNTGVVNVGAAGTLDVTNSETIGNLLGSGLTTVATGQTLTVGVANGVYSGGLSGAGNLALVGAGNYTLSGALTNGGNVSVSGFTAANVATFSGTNTVNGGFRVTDASHVVFNGSNTVSNASALTLTGASARADIGAGGSLVSTNGAGIVAQAANQTISNAGLVSGSTFGVIATGAGTTISNLSGGAIQGSSGVYSVGPTVTNANNASITATTGTAVRLVTAGSSLTNAGTITGGSTFSGVFFDATGTVTNQAGGTISNTATAVQFNGTTGSSVLDNAGSILNSNTNSAVYFSGTGTVTNRATGTIASTNGYGVQLAGANAVVNNLGTITAGMRAVSLDGANGTLTNAGSITGVNGTVLAAGGLVNNSGSIVATSISALRLFNGATVNNLSGGVVRGATNGIDGAGSLVTVTNAGTITGQSGAGILLSGGGSIDNLSGGSMSGTTGAIVSSGAFADTVTLRAGSTTSGGISLGAGADTLTLFAGAVTSGVFDGGADVDAFVVAGAGSSSFDIGRLINFESRAMNGTGTFTLTGVDTSTAAWSVNSGTLALSGGSAVNDAAVVNLASGATLALLNSERIGGLNGAGAVTLGANTLALAGNSTFSGVASGTGGLTVEGGVTTLSGANTYTGTTAVTGGTLVLAASNVIADGSALVVGSGATLNMGAFNDTVRQVMLNGTLAGTGTLTAATYALNGATVNANLGAGNLFNVGGTSVLNGTSGAANVTVQAGTLRLGASERLADTAVLSIASGSTFDVNGNQERIGALFGTGNLTVGAGNLTFGGPDSAFGGVISGTGSITHTGGLFTLMGAQTISSIRNTGGELRLLGSTTGGVALSGGSLTGGGTINGLVNVTNGATLSPGLAGQNNGIGGFTVGSLALNGGRLAIDVLGTSGNNLVDQLMVRGNANLTGGILAPTFVGPVTDFNFSTRYVFLSAASLTGTFANGADFTADPTKAGLFWRVRYDLAPNSAVLELRQLTTFNPGASASGNQNAVANALNGGQIQASDAFGAVLSVLAGLNPGQQRAAFDSLGGEAIADTTTSLLTLNDGFITTVREAGSDHQAAGGGSLNFASQLSFTGGRDSSASMLADVLNAYDPSAPVGGASTGWFSAYASDARLNGKNGTASLDSRTNGFAGGYGARVGPFLIGGAAGVAKLEGEVDRRLSTFDADVTQGALYVRFDDGQWAADVTASAYRGDMDTVRGISIGSFGGLATGRTDFDGRSVSASLARRFQVTPTATVAIGAQATASRINVDAFTEQGAGVVSLAVGEQERSWQTGQISVRGTQDFKLNGQNLSVYAGAGVMGTAGDRSGSADMRFTGAPTGFGAFTVEGVETPPMAGVADFGVQTKAGQGVTISAGYRGVFSDRLHDNQIGVRVRMSW